ncbi:Uncharacterised protein [Vibrio cholerae]|nr:Uncharacterised protein [Vibrio cholerae]
MKRPIDSTSNLVEAARRPSHSASIGIEPLIVLDEPSHAVIQPLLRHSSSFHPFQS